MNNRPTTRIPVGGVNRTNQAHVTAPTDWWTLQNLRPDRGWLTQTPYLMPMLDLPAYVDEPQGQVRLLELITLKDGTHKYLVGTNRGLRYVDAPLSGDYYDPSTQTALRLVLQTAIPALADTTEVVATSAPDTLLADIAGSPTDVLAATGVVTVPDINRQVLLYGITDEIFVAIGDKVTITILTSTTASWQKSSGPVYTFTIAQNVVLDPVTGLSVAFMTTSGFNIGDTWVWECVSFPENTDFSAACKTVTYKYDQYITGYNRRILRLRDNIVTGVGYNPVYGSHCIVFYNHLVVAQYAAGRLVDGVVEDTYDISDTPWRLAWSHLNNPDQFYATDLNEADQYDFLATAYSARFPAGITGLAILNEVLYIYTTGSIYTMRYVGLPNVMQIDMFNESVGSVFPHGLVSTPKGQFFIGADNFYYNSGGGLEKIGYPIKDIFFDELVSAEGAPTYRLSLFGKFDEDRGEVVWTYWAVGELGMLCRQVIYQVDYNRWYFRNVPSINTTAPTTEIRAWTPKLEVANGDFLYSGNGCLLGNSNPEFTANGYVWDDFYPRRLTRPVCETPDLFYGDLCFVKEQESLILDAAYTQGVGIQVDYSVRDRVSDPVVFETLPKLWTPDLPERRLSYPRKSGKIFRFRFTFLGNVVSISEPDWRAIHNAVFAGYVDFIYNGDAEK